MINDIYTRTPVNRIASIVTSQNGCDDEMTLTDQRDSLARAITHIEREILGLPKKHHYRKELGVKKMRMQNQISVINKAIKKQNIRDVDLNEYIFKECRKRMSKPQWNEIISSAVAAKRLDT